MNLLRAGFLLALAVPMIPAQTTTTAWKLIWSDEFNARADTPPDAAKWNFDLGGGGWGNSEIEEYTSAPGNALEDGKGNLVIRATRDASGHYTSARLRTGKTKPGDPVDLHWKYGKIEARIKIPFAKGVWPAFWMLGSDFATVSWPQCGEVDILENFGSNLDDASETHGSLHGPNFVGELISSSYHLPFKRKLNDDFHLYSVEWSQDAIEYFVDGASYQKLTPASLPAGGQWVFNKDFFLLLNLAIGGPDTFLGTPDAATPFPQDMLIDYVRVYQRTPVSSVTPVIAPGGIAKPRQVSARSLPAGWLLCMEPICPTRLTPATNRLAARYSKTARLQRKQLPGRA